MIKLRTRTYERLLGAALIFTLLFGGAGFGSPQYIALLRIVAAIIIAIELPRLQFESMPRGAKLLLALAGALVVWGVLQMVPVPPAIWADMPGRALVRTVYTTVGWQDHWRAMNLAPDEGLLALLKIILPIAGFLAVARLTVDQRIVMLRAIVLVAMIGAAIGVFQFATGGALTLWDTDQMGSGVGFFVDRNHQGLFLEIAMVLTGLPGVFRRDARGHGGVRLGGIPMVIAIWIVLGLGVLATTSRVGIALLLPTIAGALAITSMLRGNPRRTLAIAGCFAALGVALSFTPLAQQIIARYAVLADDMRPLIWANSWTLAKSALPLGFGFGSFVSAYLAVEPLDQVIAPFVNHAHQEYLEWLLEGGIPAALLLVGALSVYITEIVRSMRSPSRGRQRTIALAAALGIGLTLVHSFDEFPLRTPMIAVVFGMLCALLFPAPETATSISRLPQGRRGWALVLALLVIPVAGFSFSAAAAVLAMSHNDIAATTQVAPWMSDGWDALAQTRMSAHDGSGAEEAAFRALAIRPLDGVALRTIAVAQLIRRPDSTAALHMLDVAGELGWRDATTQLVLAELETTHGDAQTAARHIDAIGRRSGANPDFWIGTMRLLDLPGGPDALAARLATKPSWRAQFLQDYAGQDGATPQRYEAILEALQRHGIPATATETSPAINSLWTGGYYADVGRIRTLTQQSSLVADPGFDQTNVGPLSTQITVNSWYSVDLPGTTVSVETPEPEKLLPRFCCSRLEFTI